MLFNLSTLLLWANAVVGTLAYCASPEPKINICYNVDGATPQNIGLRDFRYVAQYLRTYGRARPRHFWTMKTAEGADNCAEWEVFRYGTVLVLAKLAGQFDASVTYEDIANTIDGGVGASEGAQEASLSGCGLAGGQLDVIVNATDPYYSTPAFTSSTLVNTGIIIKIVKNKKGNW